MDMGGRRVIVTAASGAEDCCVLVIEDADVLGAKYEEVGILEGPSSTVRGLDGSDF